MSETKILDGLPMDAYQKANGISNSMLAEFARCPAAGREYMLRGGDSPTRSMIIGTAVDTLVCEPDKFKDRFHLRPDDYEANDGTRKPWSGNSKVCKQWMAEHSDRPVLTLSEAQSATEMAKAVLAEPRAERLLRDCKTQQSVFWPCIATGLQMKGRPDFVGDGFAVDLKMTRDASEQAVSKTIAGYRYFIQAALYSDGLAANGLQCDAFYFVFVEPGHQPKVNVRKLKREAVELGRMVYANEMDRVKRCMDENDWPGFSGPGTEIQEIDVPAWLYSKSGDMLTLTIGGEDIAL